MELSVLVAQMLALTYLATGVAALSGKASFAKIATDFEKSPGLTFITGFIALLFGMVLVTYHNVWVKDWTVIITVVGWISVVKGVMLMAIPESIQWFKGVYKNTMAWGLLMMALGLVFSYFGFVA